MCLIFVAWQLRPDYPLVVAANRDEFYTRPTAPAAFWEEAPELLAGRDLEGGGTWLGVTRSGRFAALTNFRSGYAHAGDAPTRGRLVSDFLQSDATPSEYLEELVPRGSEYNGFNLLVSDDSRLHWFSNRGEAPRELAPGIYGISNHLLDTPWPKVERGKRALERLLASPPIDTEAILNLLADRDLAADEDLPDTGVSMEFERALSAMFITSESYGTRSSTVLLVDGSGGMDFTERSYEPGTLRTSTVNYKVRPRGNGESSFESLGGMA